MIKKYNKFVEQRINENYSDESSVTNQQGSELANLYSEEELTDDMDMEEEEQMEEEGGDIYQRNLEELAKKLGVEAQDGKIMYNGKKIIYPSETEMYHVGNKKFKTVDEVVSFLEGESNRLVDEEADDMKLNELPREMTGEEADREADAMDEDERFAMRESKSYKKTRKFNRIKK
jgi:hypothetical protein